MPGPTTKGSWIMILIGVLTIGRVYSQMAVTPPSYIMHVLVNNMTDKSQFYTTEAELKRIAGFQRLDCKDFPPDYLTVYSAYPLSRDLVEGAFRQAGIEVFEICADGVELERAIYRRNQLQKSQH